MTTSARPWTGGETCELVVRAYLWLVCVTAPATTLVVVGMQDVGALVLFLPVAVVVTAIYALGGGVVALPFTHVLGRLLVRTRSRLVHVLAHALLAGALGAGCAEVIALVQGAGLVWPWSLALSAPAGVAATVARWRLGVVGPFTVPGTERPDVADEPAAG